MFKVRLLIGEARKRTDCQSGQNNEAVRRLERFISDFEKLCAPDITGPEAWIEWVRERTVHPDWMERLEFSALLANFGFDEQAAHALQFTTIEDDQGGDGSVQRVLLAHSNHTIALRACHRLQPGVFGVHSP